MSKACLKCGKTHDKSGVYCSRTCANSVGGLAATGKVREKPCQVCGTAVVVKARCPAAKVICISCRGVQKKPAPIKYCRVCGAEVGKCVRPDICYHQKLINYSLVKYFTFDPRTLGTLQAYEEWDRVKNLISSLYWESGKSSSVITKLFKYPNTANFKYLLGKLGIVSKSLSYAGKEVYRQPGVKLRNISPNTNYRYKHGYHISWMGNTYYYRSSYELNYMLKLDFLRVPYVGDCAGITYIDSYTCLERTAFPDFYLPTQHKLVEIKSYSTYDEQNMQDKARAYREAGYNFELRLEKDRKVPILQEFCALG